jgi:hypothetical protein
MGINARRDPMDPREMRGWAADSGRTASLNSSHMHGAPPAGVVARLPRSIWILLTATSTNSRPPAPDWRHTCGAASAAREHQAQAACRRREIVPRRTCRPRLARRVAQWVGSGDPRTTASQRAPGQSDIWPIEKMHVYICDSVPNRQQRRYCGGTSAMSEPAYYSVSCPDCGASTRLVCVTPSGTPFMDEVTFRCEACETETKRTVQQRALGAREDP